MPKTRDEPGTVTLWVEQARQGNDLAIRALWDRYEGRLASTVRALLVRFVQVAIREDAEDAARSAFYSFYQGLIRDRFTRLEDRDALWSLLRLIVKRKAFAVITREQAACRGGGFTRKDHDLDDIFSTSPDAELTAILREEYEQMLDSLQDDTLRLIAVWTLEGYTQIEIAERLGCSRATVHRKLGLIRELWAELEP